MENKELGFISEGDLEINTNLHSFAALTCRLNEMGISFEAYSYQGSVLSKFEDLERQQQYLPMVLYVNASYWFGSKSPNISKLVFFLKDHGLEYIYPSVSTERILNFAVTHSEFYWKDILIDCQPIHISNFFILESSLPTKVLFANHFNRYGSWFYNSDTSNDSRHDWRTNALNSAYEGDKSNCGVQINNLTREPIHKEITLDNFENRGAR